MKNIEFSITGDGSTVMVQDGQKPRLFSEIDHDIIKHFITLIESRYPNAHEALTEEYGQYQNFKYRAVNRFIKCNWGNDDEIKDIDADGNFNFEHVRCPLRGGDCVWEDTICHPREVNNLSKREIEVARLVAEGKSLKQIAQQLFISVRTVESHRDNIYSKLGINKQSQLTEFILKHKI
jgi:DNA-binding CsgD family transcriptional regulator